MFLSNHVSNHQSHSKLDTNSQDQQVPRITGAGPNGQTYCWDAQGMSEKVV